MMGKKGTKINMLGQTRGRWLVLEYAGRDKRGGDMWRCKCSCQLGTVRTVRGADLRNEKSQSCGCLKREKTIERKTTHGLCESHPRLYFSVHKHFRDIREGVYGYQYWTLDPRYPNNAEGVTMFCMDVIALYPEACALYETDELLELDKDNNSERIFRPEDCRFVLKRENANNRRNTLRLEDGTSLAMFCAEVGIETRENGKKSPVYNRICAMYLRGKIHPELLQRLKQDTHDQARALYEIAMKRQYLQDRVKSLRKVLEALKLREAT